MFFDICVSKHSLTMVVSLVLPLLIEEKNYRSYNWFLELVDKYNFIFSIEFKNIHLSNDLWANGHGN